MFPKSRETLRFEGKKFTVPKETRTKANFEKRAEIPATTSGHLRSRATVVNISWVTVNCFPL